MHEHGKLRIVLRINCVSNISRISTYIFVIGAMSPAKYFVTLGENRHSPVAENSQVTARWSL